MSWGQFHQVTYKSGLEEKIIGPFSFSKLMWFIPAALVSNQILNVMPKIPFIDHIVFSRIHILLPIGIAAIFAYFKDKRTNLTLVELIKTKISIRKRRRTFYYHRVNMPRNALPMKERGT